MENNKAKQTQITPKSAPQSQYKTLIKEPEKHPKEEHTAMNCSVLPEKKRHQFLTLLTEKPPDIGLNSFFFFFETISTFGSKIFPCSKECHNPIMFCTQREKSPFLQFISNLASAIFFGCSKVLVL